MRIEREWLEDLIFGGEASRRFTQDSPVLPDVWLDFGLKYCREPNTTVDLLLTPHRDHTTADLGHTILRDLKAQRRTPAWKSRHSDGPVETPRLAFNQAAVAVRLYFDELLTVLLPRTEWWSTRVRPALLRRKKPLKSAETKARVHKAMARVSDGQASSSDLGADVLWMIKVVGVVLLAARVDDDGDSGDKQFKSLLEAEARQIEVVFELIGESLSAEKPGPCPLWLVSRNRPAAPTIWRSSLAVKADAARSLFNISCSKLAWAILDSGIDAKHAAFRMRAGGVPKKLSRGNWQKDTRVVETYDFTRVRDLLNPSAGAPPALTAGLKRLGSSAKELRRALQSGRAIDWSLLEPLLRVPHDATYAAPAHAHGTHVAGILAGDWRAKPAEDGEPIEQDLLGICPDLRLYDFRVLDDKGEGDEFGVMAALQFIRHLNAHREQPIIHGANISLSIPHDVANYACGRTPVCDECERLVASGVVVVAAAGNDGYMQYSTPRGNVHGYRSISISDPGNSEAVITVGATHRYQPHTYGVSYFSSRGPTGDGRVKPDLVAPGEKIKAPVPDGKAMTKDGTSMAAPHVSGAAALLMARHRELLGDAGRIKQILCRTATDLGRERYFQGHGMVDALRALQSI